MPAKGLRDVHALPIKCAEFHEALKWAWRRHQGPGGGRKPRLGLAVSGGVDSMALATLCKRLDLTISYDFFFKAFIVDHGAREGSKAEAQKMIKQWLIVAGLHSRILTLQWPASIKPNELPDLESQARVLRYQALGRACQENGIRSLLLGHHEDDQAETVLMRLANGHRGSGLQGMKRSAEIPECFGIYGIHRSGRYAIGEEEKLNLTTGKQRSRSLDIEEGGIKIHRPLLKFSKDRLIATCRYFKTSWEEDATNKDQTLTPRNAVRHLLDGQQLPAALQKSRLLEISAVTSKRNQQREARAERTLKSCEIVRFDTRSGRLVIRFPRRILSMKVIPKEYLARKVAEERLKAAEVLYQAIDMVTPLEHVRLRKLENAVNIIFPELESGDPNYEKTDPDSSIPSFTVAGVSFDHIHWPLFIAESDSIDDRRVKEKLDPTHVWVLNRQPYSNTLNEMPKFSIAGPSKSLTVSTASNHLRVKKPEWYLFDGRFWIQILNLTSHPIVLRPFAVEDRKLFANALSPTQRQRLRLVLNGSAPGKVRYTLPVLAEETTGEVLAFPTLGIQKPGAEAKVQWQARYKHVDIPSTITPTSE
ncbi:MAG: hypothetical protein M1827_002412 [Pycnora praestabilis]|nr:MAG: hypothetical protein M1827_002412 [Pycnora praestabilis]